MEKIQNMISEKWLNIYHQNRLSVSIILFLFVTVIHVKADTWEPEKTMYYYSENKTYMLKVVPLTYPAKFWNANYNRLKRKNKLSGKDTTIFPCTGTLYKIIASDTSIVWEKKLINRICPVSAIVSNDGSSVITFDNWLMIGYGSDIMVAYNELGELKKRYKLEDISPFPINDYPSSISSLFWCCGKKYTNNDSIEICFENRKNEIIKRIYNVRKLTFEPLLIHQSTRIDFESTPVNSGVRTH